MIFKQFHFVVIGFLFYGSTAAEAKEFCNKTLGEVANAQMNFVGCAVRHTSPANTCEPCLEWHTDMTEKYNLLISNKTCAKEMLSKNRLNTLYNMQKYLLDVWNKGFCDDCFDNGTISNETKRFHNLTTKFDNCIQAQLKFNKSEICSNCSGNYSELNFFYKKMDEKKGGQICFDTQDKMNRTRSLWSKDFNCCHREYNLMFFTIASSFFAILPIIFYFGMYGYTKRIERNHEVLDAGLTITEHASTSTGIQAAGATSNIEERTSRRRDSSSDEDIINDFKKQRNVSTLENPPNKILKPSSSAITTSSNEIGTLIDL